MSNKKDEKLDLSDVIKNPNRNLPRVPFNYEPEYVKMGISPISAPEGFSSVKNPRANTIHNSATATNTNIELKINEVPQVSFPDTIIPGEQEGESFDLMDDISLNENGIIDNNDYVDFVNNSPTKKQEPKIEVKSVSSAVNPDVGEYILMVMGKFIISGQKSEVEYKIRSIMYGEDEEFKGTNITVDDIVLLKRVPIKVGIFIND